MAKIFYIDRKSEILAALQGVARERRTITYRDLGEKVGGIPQNGPWKGVLDSIAEDETRAGRPDITYLIVRKSTGYPGQIAFEPSVKPTEAQKKTADAVFLKVWNHYAKA